MASFQQNIKQLILSIYKTSTQHWLYATGLIVSLCIVLIWASVYIGSAYWTAYQFKQQLLKSDSSTLEQHIPLGLLTPYQAKPLARHVKLHTPGQRYLSRVWPHIIKQQDLYKLLLLQADANREQSPSTDFIHFPSTIRLTWGKGQNQLWFEWQRASWRTWQLSQLCFYNPQPLEEVKSCESSNR